LKNKQPPKDPPQEKFYKAVTMVRDDQGRWAHCVLKIRGSKVETIEAGKFDIINYAKSRAIAELEQCILDLKRR